MGSGLGLLAADAAQSASGARVVGIERSPEQLAAAIRDLMVTHVRGDAERLPFRDRTFDLTYCRYVLEHVSDPVTVTREMRRVTRPGGRVAACENDTTLVRFDPPCPAFDRVWSAFGGFQAYLGGDALIGRRLFRVFRQAGLTRIELSVQPEVHWHGSPAFTPWVENIIGNVESARVGMIRAGFAVEPDLDAAIAELHALMRNPDASATFVWNRAMATNES